MSCFQGTLLRPGVAVTFDHWNFTIAKDNGDGTFTAAPFEFSMPGYWVLHATVADENGTEERIDFDVDCCE